LLEQKHEMEFRDLGKQPLSEAELDGLIGRRDYRLFLNPRNELYRARDMKRKPPSRSAAIKLMARNPNLIRRPIVVAGSRIVIGYDEAALSDLG
jgi:arsenate reductase-like glutaredoxin family protein